MKIIHKYVLREHVGPAVFAASALTSLMLLNYIAKQLGNLVGKGLSGGVIAEFFLLSLPFTVAMTLPMAVLVAVLYAFSRLAAENEITAMKANGVSMRRIMLPVLGWGMMATLGMILFNDRLLPLTNHRLRTLQGDIARKKPSFALKEQIINEVSPGQFFLRTTHLDPVTNKMRDVTIYDLSDALRRHTIYADSGVMAFTEDGSDLKLTLFNGFIQEVPKEEPTKLQRLYYNIDEIRVKNVANAFERDSSDTYKSDREMSVCELQGEVATYETEFFRARERYTRAANVAKANPKGQVKVLASTVSDGPTLGPRPPRRARVNSLGRSYCDVAGAIDTIAVPWVRKRVKQVAQALAPAVAFARGRDTTKARQDTVRKSDTTKARLDSIRRADSLKAARVADSLKAARVADSIKAAAAAKPVQPAAPAAVPAAPTPTPPGAIPTPGVVPDTTKRDSTTAAVAGATGVPPLDSTGAPKPDSAAVVGVPIPPAESLGVSPSTGLAPTVPVTVEMESARAEMLRWRTQINQYAVEIHKKFAISVACTVFVLLGAPLALRFPRGGVGLVIGVSLVVFALYYVGLIAGESLSDRDILSPALSMWAANIVFTLAGLILVARMERDGGSARGAEPVDWGNVLRTIGRRLTFRRGPA